MPPAPVVILGRAVKHAYNRIAGHNGDGDGSGYTRLTIVITRTASSTDSYELGGGGGAGQEGAWYDEDGNSRFFRWFNPSNWPSIIGDNDQDTKHGYSDNNSGAVKIAWNNNKRSLYAWIVGIILGVIVISSAYKATTSSSSSTSLVAVALQNGCGSMTGNLTDADRVGWFKHPTVYPLDASRQAHQRHMNMRPQEFQLRTSQSCADLWVAKGELCRELQVAQWPDGDDTDLGRGRKGRTESVLGDADLDVAWSFVEPSPYWRKWELAYKGESQGQEDEGTGAKHFRSYDEIRYSIRSVVQNLPFVKKMTLLATTLPSSPPPSPPPTSSAEELSNVNLDAFSAQQGCRVAQTPDWMRKEKVKLTPHGNSNNISKLEVLSQWEQFDAQSTDQEEILAWKHSVLPTFNSHSIESQLYNLPQPSETVLYMNNDFYIGRPLTASDLSTRIFGPVFKIYPHSWSTGAETLEDAMAIDGEGNARVMPNTIRHLDNRFGRRDRNYPDHVGYVLSTAMMDEVAKIWSEELKETASVRFRGRGPEVWLPLLTMYYIIEKQREATLWSFLVAKSDIDGDNSYNLSERQTMLSNLDWNRDGDLLHFRSPRRTWDDSAHKQIIESAGITVPNETQLYWTAANGYPYVSGEEGNHVFPAYDGANDNFCTVSISECFGRPGFFDDESEGEMATFTPEDLMKHASFAKHKCGDCLIAALLSKSGPRGFEAFLPDPKTDKHDSSIDTQTRVTLIGGWDKAWQNATYNLKETVPKEWNRRDFAVRLIQRYTFAFGETPTAFNQLNNDPGWIDWFLWRWSEDRASFMALNDHVTTDNATLQQQIREKVMKFQENMWPVPTEYEQI